MLSVNKFFDILYDAVDSLGFILTSREDAFFSIYEIAILLPHNNNI